MNPNPLSDEVVCNPTRTHATIKLIFMGILDSLATKKANMELKLETGERKLCA